MTEYVLTDSVHCSACGATPYIPCIINGNSAFDAVHPERMKPDDERHLHDEYLHHEHDDANEEN